MAFFKFRKAAGEPSAPAPAPESVDVLRKRARYRLAGASMLVLAGVVGFPLLFDNQPRPIAVDIPIDIPDKAKVKPMSSGPLAEASRPTEPTTTASTAAPRAAAPPVAVVPKVADAQKEEVILSTSKPATAAPAAKADSKADTKTAAKASDKPVEKASDKVSEKPAATGRFIVQFGAFSESARAQEARFKVEKTGLKTYAQVADTPDGKKYRVRVGPFDKRSDAEKAAEKIKKLGLPAAILGL
jgi:DedD protein